MCFTGSRIDRAARAIFNSPHRPAASLLSSLNRIAAHSSLCHSSQCRALHGLRPQYLKNEVWVTTWVTTYLVLVLYISNYLARLHTHTHMTHTVTHNARDARDTHDTHSSYSTKHLPNLVTSRARF